MDQDRSKHPNKIDYVLIGILIFITGVISASVYTAFYGRVEAPIDKGIRARWVFRSNLGQIARDLSGQNHTGIIHNPNWTRGRGYLALKLEGETFVEIEDGNELLSSDEFTIAAWIYPQSLNQRMVLFQKTESGELDYPPITFYAPWGNGRLGLVLSDGKRRVGFLSNGSIHTGHWHHVAVTFDNNTGKINFFIDGKQAGERQTSLKPKVSSGKLFIGTGLFSGEKDFYFQGKLDSLSLYNRVLTLEEIQTLASSK